MATTYPAVLSEVLALMTQLAGDWEYDEPVTADTALFGEMGLESLDLVVLGTAIQERYGRLPFTEFFAAIGQRPNQDVTVRELAEFICQPQSGPVSSAAHG